MTKSCNVDSCTRFTVTQWIISIALVIMVAMQSYIISRVDKIETNVKDVKVSVETINAGGVAISAASKINEQRISALENSVTRLFLREKQ